MLCLSQATSVHSFHRPLKAKRGCVPDLILISSDPHLAALGQPTSRILDAALITVPSAKRRASWRLHSMLAMTFGKGSQTHVC